MCLYIFQYVCEYSHCVYQPIINPWYINRVANPATNLNYMIKSKLMKCSVMWDRTCMYLLESYAFAMHIIGYA